MDLYLARISFLKSQYTLIWCLFLFPFYFSVFKFVEHPENNENVLQKCKVKFKILSLKVKEPMDYAPELVCALFFLSFYFPACLLILVSLEENILQLTTYIYMYYSYWNEVSPVKSQNLNDIMLHLYFQWKEPSCIFRLINSCLIDGRMEDGNPGVRPVVITRYCLGGDVSWLISTEVWQGIFFHRWESFANC